jgi:hypothetical protein
MLTSVRPRRNRVEDQQDHLDDGHRDFGALRDLPFRAGVAGLRVCALAETEQHVDEVEAPADEHDRHQPVHEDDHLVEFGGMGRGRDREPEIIQH